MTCVRIGVLRLLAPLMLMAASGCFSGVRLLRETPDGGVVSIPSDSNQWPTYYRNRAEALMKKKCPNGYVIDNEEEIEENPAANDGRHANEDFEYDGAYIRIANSIQRRYDISFHCASPSPPPPPTDWLP